MDDNDGLPPAVECWVCGWEDTRTLSDQGNCMIKWLRGVHLGWPGHPAPPAAETAELTELLVQINATGIVTLGSQPAIVPYLHEQRAYLDGYGPRRIVDYVVAYARQRGHLADVWDTDWQVGPTDVHTVTRWCGQETTRISRFSLRDVINTVDVQFGHDALVAMEDSCSFYIVDSQWDRCGSKVAIFDDVLEAARSYTYQRSVGGWPEVGQGDQASDHAEHPASDEPPAAATSAAGRPVQLAMATTWLDDLDLSLGNVITCQRSWHYPTLAPTLDTPYVTLTLRFYVCGWPNNCSEGPFTPQRLDDYYSEHEEIGHDLQAAYERRQQLEADDEANPLPAVPQWEIHDAQQDEEVGTELDFMFVERDQLLIDTEDELARLEDDSDHFSGAIYQTAVGVTLRLHKHLDRTNPADRSGAYHDWGGRCFKSVDATNVAITALAEALDWEAVDPLTNQPYTIPR